MVTHEDDIAAHAKRVIRMRDGLIIDDGPSPRHDGRAGRRWSAPAAVDGVDGHWDARVRPGRSGAADASNEELTH